MSDEAPSAPGHVGAANAVAPAIPGKKRYFAKNRLVQDGKAFEADGTPLPDDFPESSLKLLLQAGDVVEHWHGRTSIKEVKE